VCAYLCVCVWLLFHEVSTDRLCEPLKLQLKKKPFFATSQERGQHTQTHTHTHTHTYIYIYIYIYIYLYTLSHTNTDAVSLSQIVHTSAAATTNRSGVPRVHTGMHGRRESANSAILEPQTLGAQSGFTRLQKKRDGPG
jgi:hypothetical protein